jgi:biotin-(acetyl-CoA carboxylase) ligase
VTVLEALLRRLDTYLDRGDGPLASDVGGRWEALLWRRAQAVRVEQDGTTLYGVVEGLSRSGALRLRAPDGELLEVAVGDLSSI